MPRPFYARGARSWERDNGLPVVRSCVVFTRIPGKIVFFSCAFWLSPPWGFQACISLEEEQLSVIKAVYERRCNVFVCLIWKEPVLPNYAVYGT